MPWHNLHPFAWEDGTLPILLPRLNDVRDEARRREMVTREARRADVARDARMYGPLAALRPVQHDAALDLVTLARDICLAPYR